MTAEFQSRNRGSCRFKATAEFLYYSIPQSFNLVIEVLVVSSRHAADALPNCVNLFQSRNRGSCRFKGRIKGSRDVNRPEFQSRNRGSCRFKGIKEHPKTA